MSNPFIYVPQFDFPELTPLLTENLRGFNHFDPFETIYYPNGFSKLPIGDEKEFFALVEFLSRWSDHVKVMMDCFKSYFTSALKGKRFAFSSLWLESKIKKDIGLIQSQKEIKSVELKKFFIFSFESALMGSRIIESIDRYFYDEITSSGVYKDGELGDFYLLKFYDEKGHERGEVYANGILLHFHAFFHKTRIVDYLSRQLPFLTYVLMYPIGDIREPYRELIFEIRNYLLDELGDLVITLLEDLERFKLVWEILSKRDDSIFKKIISQRLAEIENYFVCLLRKKQIGHLEPWRRIEIFGGKDIERLSSAFEKFSQRGERIFLVSERVKLVDHASEGEATQFLNLFSLNDGDSYLRCECGNTDQRLFAKENGEIVCKSCGLVVFENILM